jgi:hypothetical protein
MRPDSSSPMRVRYALRAPLRAAAMTMFEVSPPKPCRNVRSPGRVWLNSTIGPPMETIIGSGLAENQVGDPQDDLGDED